MDRDRPRLTLAGPALAILPVAFLAVFFVLPVATIVSMGFDGGELADVAGNGRIRSVVWFTLWQAIVSTALTVAAALPAAWAIARFRFPGRRVLQAAVVVPFVLPSVVVGAAFRALGVDGSIPAVLLAHAFFNVAVVVRTVGGYWSNLDPRAEEAGRVLGAGRLQAFLHVTLPRLAPAVAAAAAIVFLFTFSSFGVVLILGPPGLATLEVEIYRRTAQFLDLPAAAALTIVQLATVVALLVVNRRLTDRLTRTQEVRRSSEVARLPRGWAERAGVALAAGGTALALALPLTVLVGRGVPYLDDLSSSRAGSILFVPPWEAVANSLAFGAVATVVALVVGVPAAVLVARRRTMSARVLDTLLMLPLATSAVTVGFGFLVALDEPPLDLRSSPWLIPLAHALVALPFVVRVLVPIVRRTDQRLREAASVLGAGPARVWREVDLPLLARGGAVAAGFAFAVSLGEFGATVFIARPDYPTLPIAVFRFLGQPGAANAGQAAALATVLMAVTAVAVLAVDRFRPAGTEF